MLISIEIVAQICALFLVGYLQPPDFQSRFEEVGQLWPQFLIFFSGAYIHHLTGARWHWVTEMQVGRIAN